MKNKRPMNTEFLKYWAASASASVMADYRSGAFVAVTENADKPTLEKKLEEARKKRAE